MHFQFEYLCNVATYDITFCFRPVYYKRILHTGGILTRVFYDIGGG